MSQTGTKKEKVKFLTLGCRLNQYETQAVREDLLRNDYEEARKDETPDIFVINTCTVTSDADRESRYLIRKCHRENPDAKVVVTGCYVERDYKTVAEIPGVTHVVLNRQKSELANLLGSCTQLTFQAAGNHVRSKADYVPLSISQFSGRRRAYIKIQDGCNHACTFCKVVLVRGKSRSRFVSEIVEEAKRLRDHGSLEIVLTGIQLGAYGLDLEPSLTLTDILEPLSEIEGIERIRLSSIEPNDVTDSLIRAIREIPKMCHHLHIPLQSGSNEILKAMNRRYAKERYLDLINRLRQGLEDFILTTDVMAGFPGESDEHFKETVDAVLAAQPFKLHIFPYSAREGTRAFQSKAVPQDIIKKRMGVLFQLESKLKRDIGSRYLGREFKILIEDSSESDWLCGHTHNYLPIRIPASCEHKANDFISVQIDQFQDNVFYGHVHSETQMERSAL